MHNKVKKLINELGIKIKYANIESNGFFGIKNKKAILLSLDFIKPLLEPHEPHIHTSHYSHTHSPDTLSQYTPTASTEYILLLYKRYSTEAIV